MALLRSASLLFGPGNEPNATANSRCHGDKSYDCGVFKHDGTLATTAFGGGGETKAGGGKRKVGDDERHVGW